MKYRVFGLLVVAALAACSGGGSSDSTANTDAGAATPLGAPASTAEPLEATAAAIPEAATVNGTIIRQVITSATTTSVSSSAATPTVVSKPAVFITTASTSAANTSMSVIQTPTMAVVNTPALSNNTVTTNAANKTAVLIPMASTSSVNVHPTAAATATATAVKASATINATSNTVASPSAAVTKSISGWVTCDGISDDSLGVARAFQAARNNAFTLVVDCPVLIHVGTDITRSIFIDNGTAVEFTGSGKFTVDNVFLPAFVIANSSNITLTNWNVEYDAGLPVNMTTGGYEDNGKFMVGDDPGSAFNDFRLTPWLATNRAIIFNRSQGGVGSAWASPTNTCAVFFIIGDTSNVIVTGMNVYVPASAGGDRFVPVVFSFSANFKSNQTVTAKTPRNANFFAVPHDLTFSNIVFDGTYMGWVGGVQNAVFEHIQSHRYGDLQDSKGQNVGGVKKWFAPPHLLYLAYAASGDPGLFNTNIRISDVVDDGPRIGSARDKGGSDTISGYALSLKIGCIDCSVDTYKTNRPDGFLDVLPSNGLTISNVDATYDSAFLNNLFPGWRFPSIGYKNLTFENISIKDLAPISTQPPIGSASQPTGAAGIVFKNIQIQLNRWQGKGPLIPNIAGQGNDVALAYTVTAEDSQIMSLQKDTVSLSLQATPSTLRTGGASVLTWTSKDANSCSAAGAWSGALATGASRTVKFDNAGNYDFTFNCQNASASSSTTLPLVVNP